MNPRGFQHLISRSVALRLIMALLWVIGCAFPIPAYAQGQSSFTLIVDTTVDDNSPAFQGCTTAPNDCSLRGAISKANADTANTYTVKLSASTYSLTLSGTNENNNATGDLDIFGNLTLVGEGADSTIINGNQMDRVIHITGPVTVEISSLKITGGKTVGFIYNASTLGSEDGGGIYVEGSIFQDLANNPVVTLRNLSVTANSTGSNYTGGASGDGGGISSIFSTVTIVNSTISSNQTGHGAPQKPGGSGGGIYNWHTPLTLVNSHITGNTTGDGGDGVSSGGGGAAGNGGGIYNNGDHLVTLIDTTVSLNQAGAGGYGGGTGGAGAGIYNYFDSIMTITHSEITGNTSGYGGGGTLIGMYGQGAGIFNYSALTIEGSSVKGNTSVGNAGGIFSSTGELKLTHSDISFNIAALNGGGLYLGSCPNNPLTVEGNTIQGNKANTGNLGDGAGGVFIDRCDVTLTNNIITDNHIGMVSGSSPYLYGAGIYVEYADLTSKHNTIARNTGGNGAGIHLTHSHVYADGRLFSTAMVTNTIIVDQVIGIYVNTTSSATLNAVLWGSGEWANGANWGGAGTVTPGAIQIIGNPGFVGPDTGDYHIGLTSAAIDQGVDTDVLTDMDGEVRSFGSHPDLGADELAVTLSITKVGPVSALRGEPILYTLTITNSGALPASDLVITDSLPVGSQYTSGGTLLPGNIVEWTVPSLAAGGTLPVQFSVTATQTITNSDYHVSCAQGVSVGGTLTVVTSIRFKNYLPITNR